MAASELQIQHQARLKADLDLMTFIDFPSLCFPPSLLVNWSVSDETLMESLQNLHLAIKQYVSQNTMKAVKWNL